MALDEPNDNDETFDNSDLKFLVELDLMKKCGDIKVDYMESGPRSGFSISSTIPIAGGGGGCAGSCGAGSCG